MKKILILAILLLSLIPIYVNSIDNKINYLALGDSLAIGQNAYNEIDFGYSDYIKNYLEKADLLEYYTKDFSVGGYTIKDLMLDIENNKKIESNGKKITLQHALKDANLITISIGANDMMGKIGLAEINLEQINVSYGIIDETVKNLETLIVEIKKYSNAKIIIVGYYNPISSLTDAYDNELEPIFIYINNKYRALAEKNNLYYVDIYRGFRSNATTYLPNPLNIHPSREGYRFMADEIIKVIEEKVIN